MTKKKHEDRNARKSQSGSNRNTMILAVLLIGLVGYWAFTQFSGAGDYPGLVEGVFYQDPTVSADGGGVAVPKEFVEENRLVFIDVKLEEPATELVYQGRTIPLSLYGDGEVLPLIVISTPKGKVITGIRVCEPCGSFSFHIVEKKYLQCDACGTRWNIETLQGVSGGCTSYPPPALTASTSDAVQISIAPTGLRARA